MKTQILFITLILAAIACSNNKSGKKQVWVLDTEHILTEKQVASLDSLYKAHEKITSNEIGLVTTAQYGTDTSILAFATSFGKLHGIGKEKINNGVIIAFSQANRNVAIATGYGTKKVLTDELAKKIIDSLMTPQFREAKYFEGLWLGSKAIVEFLERPENKIK